MKQLKLNSRLIGEASREFGGSLFKGKRKSARPLSSKHALHLVLRSDTSQSGSIRKHISGITKMLENYSRKFNIKLYKFAIAGNHIHIVLHTSHKSYYRAWIRTLTGRLALQFKIRFALRPWSRVLSWGREFKSVIQYVWQNILEAEGVIPYQPRTYKKRRSTLAGHRR